MPVLLWEAHGIAQLLLTWSKTDTPSFACYQTVQWPGKKRSLTAEVILGSETTYVIKVQRNWLILWCVGQLLGKWQLLGFWGFFVVCLGFFSSNVWVCLLKSFGFLTPHYNKWRVSGRNGLFLFKGELDTVSGAHLLDIISRILPFNGANKKQKNNSLFSSPTALLF